MFCVQGLTGKDGPPGRQGPPGTIVSVLERWEQLQIHMLVLILLLSLTRLLRGLQDPRGPPGTRVLPGNMENWAHR